MSPAEVLDRLVKSYSRYYNVRTEDVEPPFAAEAVFHSHDEQYFLLKSAKLSESESHEYVFIATGESMTLEDVRALDEKAWETGMARVRPRDGHRSTDVVLIILAEHLAPEAMEYIRKLKRSRSYRFTLHGWSNYQAIALETSTGNLSANRRGRDLRKLFRNIKSS